MANIRKLGQNWQARVRRRGFPDETKSFPSKAEAERWARSIEGEMDRGEFVSRTEAEQTTFGEVIQRYMETITPTKRGHVGACPNFCVNGVSVTAEGSAPRTGW